MAEIIKEFVNKTFTSSDIINNNEIVLFTNNDATQAIVKDIIVQNSDIAKTDAKFYIGGIEVMDTFESASGLLFIDKGQSLSVKLNTALTVPSYTKLHLDFINTTSSSDKTYKRYEKAIPSAGQTYALKAGILSNNLVQVADYSSETPLTSIIDTFYGASSYHGNVYRNSTGSWFYYGMNTNDFSTSQLRTAANAVSNVDTGNYTGPALDKAGQRIIYHQNSSSNARYADASGSTVSNTTWSNNWPSNTSTYAHGAYAGDLYVYRYSGFAPVGGFLSGQPQDYYFGMTNHMNPGSNSNYVMVYNSTEEAYYSFLFNGEAAVESTSGTLIEYFTKADIVAALNSGNGQSVTQTVLLNNGNFSAYLGLGDSGITATSWHVRPLGGPYLGVPINSSTYKVYACENQSLKYTADLTGNTISTSKPAKGETMYDVYKAPTSSSLAITDYDIETTIRAVGIEMT